MGRMVRSCIQSLLKVANSGLGMVGIAMIIYALWMIRDWTRHVDHAPPSPFIPPDSPAPWFMYTFLAIGIILCVITCSGHIAAETASGCCLYFGRKFASMLQLILGLRTISRKYMLFVFLLLIFEAALTADIFLNYKWEEDFPVDPTGYFNEFKKFVKKHFELCKWIGLSVVCIQGLCLLLSMILKALGPLQERHYDSDDDYSPDRVPLLKNYVQTPYVVGDPVHRSKNDSWNIRINDKANR